jgi:aminoglycoside 6'-N-acetyltransferase I
VGRKLVEAAEGWARRHRCLEFASDALPDNRVSLAAHRSLGFADAGTVVCFRKDLPRARRSAS